MKKIIILLIVSIGLLSCFSEKKPLPKGVMLIEELDEVKSDKIIINEFFWYGCPHCNKFRPYIQQFSSQLPNDVVLNHIPVPLKAEWIDHAKMYYAIKDLGFSYELHNKIFNEIHNNKNNLNNEDKILDFVEKLGFDKESFKKIMNSKAVEDRVLKDSDTIMWLGLKTTPVITINNKYQITVKSAGGYNKVIPVVKKTLEYIKSNKD